MDSIGTDLDEAIKERGYQVDAPIVADMAALLAAGEDVTVGVHSGPERPQHNERAW